MKNMLFTLLALTVTVSAQATSLHPDTFALRSQLTSFNVDERLSTATVISGQVVVNEATRMARLELVLGCRKDAPVCKEIARLQVVELPIIRITRDGLCNAKVYHARKDARPVDGALQVLRIEDLNTIRGCAVRIDPNGLTQVEYKTSYILRTENKTVNTLSTFEGRSLAGGK